MTTLELEGTSTIRQRSSQEIADLLLAQWRLLWWAKPADRIRMIDEIKADYWFEHALDGVREALEESQQ